jgi:TRAP-type C4-dicarboxylate transport system permease small subunit
MAGLNLFMLVWGVRLVHTTWFQSISDFPSISVGISYLPVPIGGAIMLLFVIERLWTGRLFEEPAAESLVAASTD